MVTSQRFFATCAKNLLSAKKLSNHLDKNSKMVHTDSTKSYAICIIEVSKEGAL